MSYFCFRWDDTQKVQNTHKKKNQTAHITLSGTPEMHQLYNELVFHFQNHFWQSFTTVARWNFRQNDKQYEGVSKDGKLYTSNSLDNHNSIASPPCYFHVSPLHYCHYYPCRWLHHCYPYRLSHWPFVFQFGCKPRVFGVFFLCFCFCFLMFMIFYVFCCCCCCCCFMFLKPM